MSSKKQEIVDLLDEDKPISGQKWVCMSFISPEDIIKQKNMYLFEHFIREFDLEKSMKKFHQFLNYLSYTHHLDFNIISKQFDEFVKEEKDKLIETTIEDDYKSFLDRSEESLMKKFNKDHDFQTNVRGLKVRGCFATEKEAQTRCQMLRKIDPHHDIYVGPVGVWIPWHPEAYKTGKVEYLDKELNELMKKKNENDKKAKEEFDERIKETRRKAIRENVEKAKKHKNKLSQNINEEGELVNVSQTPNTVLSSLNDETATSQDIKQQLFEGEDIVRTRASDAEKEKKEHGGQEED